jgi:uncharacterized protein with GYD domain
VANYVALIDWTEQGVSGFKDSVERQQAASGQLEAAGVRFKDIYWTLGGHDIVAMRHLMTKASPLGCSLWRLRATSGVRPCARSARTRCGG